MRIMNIFICKVGHTSNLRYEIIIVIHKLIKSIYKYITIIIGMVVLSFDISKGNL